MRLREPDGLRVGILVGSIVSNAWVAPEVRPAGMELQVAAHSYSSVVANELALKDIPGHSANSHKLNVGVLALGGDAMHRGMLEIAKTIGTGPGKVQVDATGVIMA